jgi:hypothetical protein
MAQSKPKPGSQGTAKQESYRERQKELGFVMLQVWVPDTDIERLRGLCAKARAKKIRDEAVNN